MAKFIVIHSVRVATDFVPQTFGRLTTIGPRFRLPVGKKGAHQFYQVCICKCGTIKAIRGCELVTGHTKSCGCLCTEIITTHGHHRGGKASPEAEAYRGMITRCTNPNHHAYPYYGGRGIAVFSDWCGPGGFERWLAYIGPKPSPELSQERDKVHGNYEPGNVRWATIQEQNNNKRNTVLLTYNGETKTQAQWSRDIGISVQAVARRLKAGWSVEKALTTPVKRGKS